MDSIAPAHSSFFFHSLELREGRQYMAAITTLAQALELYFALYLRVRFVYRPFWADKDRNVDDANSALDALYSKTSRHPYAKMRDTLFWVAAEPLYQNLEEAKMRLRECPENPLTPPDHWFSENFERKRIAELLLGLKRLRVHELRNRITHKEAYRPTREEVDEVVHEVESLLFPLSVALEAREDDINAYQD